MQGSVVELARQAAAAARAERAARGEARLPVRRYRGVQRRGDMYVALIMDADGLRPLWFGPYATPEEAAYAYDAAARIMHGNRARPNFPEPPAPALAGAGGGGGALAAHAGVLPLVGHARVRAPLYGLQLAPPQVPAVPVGGGALVGQARVRSPLYGQQLAPVGGGEQRQAFPVQQAPAPHFLLAPPVPYYPGAAPAFSQYFYRPAAGPVFAAAGGSTGVGFYDMAPIPMIGPEPEVPMTNYAASSELSSSDKKYKAPVDAPAAADPKLFIFIESGGEPVVEDNFTGDGGASTSSAARPAVPPLRLKDLMEVVGRSADEGEP